MKRLNRPTAWAVTVAFAVMLSAHCVTPGAMTEAQMVCCATMGSECRHHAQDQSCCSTEIQRIEQLPAVKPLTMPRPDAVIGLFAVLPEVSKHWLVDHGYRFDGFTPKPPSVHRYLLLSVLLI